MVYEKLYPKVYNLENLKLAHKHAKRGKGWYKEVREVDKDEMKYLRKIRTSLIKKTYKTSSYSSFVKCESGKKRKIYKLPYYPDRIVQWAVVQVIESYLIAEMVEQTFSAIPGRGSKPILDTLGSKNNILITDEENTKYCLKLDIKKYYPSIPHHVLNKKYAELFADKDLLWLLNEITDSISTFPYTEENAELMKKLGMDAVEFYFDDEKFIKGVGIAIGNYLSQYSGNYNLSALDHYVMHDDRCKYYFRYMDDIVVLGKSKEELHSLLKDIETFLLYNSMQVVKSNWQVFPTRVRGIDFVGYRFFGDKTILRKSIIKRIRNRMKYFSYKRINNKPCSRRDWCAFNSYKGYLKYSSCKKFYRKYVLPNEKYMHDYYIDNVKKAA